MSKLLRVYPQTTPLQGEISVPGDKSISHRAVMLGALAEGTSVIDHWLPAGDTLATLAIFQALGINIEIEEQSPQSWRLVIHGRGLRGLQPPGGPLNCQNAGTCLRLLAGIMAGQSFAVTLDGSDQLRRRPMNRIVAPLREMGANISDQNGRAPLRIQPARLRAIQYRLKVASAQVKSALLLAGLYAEGETAIYQPGPARDHSERMLQAMGVAIERQEDEMGGMRLALSGPAERLRPLDLTIPGDISSAAFPLIAAAIIPHSQVTIKDVGYNETRTGILDLLRAMGGRLEIGQERLSGGEPAADLSLRRQTLRAADAGGSLVVRAIDEFPVWATAASQAAGRSRLRDAAELRVKEVDRISRLAGELRKMGAAIEEYDDGMAITGLTPLAGATVNSHGDHRLGMALAVAALAADGPTLIEDAACIADSFPGFVETMQALGANMVWVE